MPTRASSARPIRQTTLRRASFAFGTAVEVVAGVEARRGIVIRLWEPSLRAAQAPRAQRICRAERQLNRAPPLTSAPW